MEDFYNFCKELGGVTAEVMCEILAVCNHKNKILFFFVHNYVFLFAFFCLIYYSFVIQLFFSIINKNYTSKSRDFRRLNFIEEFKSFDIDSALKFESSIVSEKN